MDRPHQWPRDRKRREPSLYDEYLTQERNPYQGDASNATTTPPISRGSNNVNTKTGRLARSESTDVGMSRALALAAPSPGRSRPRRLTLDGTMSAERPSPSTLRRHRIGSVQHSGSAMRLTEDGSLLPESPRTVAPPRSDVAHTSASSSPPIPSANARRIQHLMKTSRGRISGNIYFRRGKDSPWIVASCTIQEDSGSLICESATDGASPRTLVSDLGGCRLRCMSAAGAPLPFLELSVPSSGLDLHLRLASRTELDSWFAALLCWQPMRPKDTPSKPKRTLASAIPGWPLLLNTRHDSETSLLKEAPVIKVGRMIYWDTNTSYSATTATSPTAIRPQAMRLQSHGSRWWKRVSCTLRENGELKFYTESDSLPVTIVQLSQLSRYGIQRLDPSVLEYDYCLAIVPQYTSSGDVTNGLRQPIYLSLESRILLEVWLVLLRAFTVPQIYGPKQTELDDRTLYSGSTGLTTADTGMFRLESSLAVRVVEAKLNADAMPEAHTRHPNTQKPDSAGGHYVEIQLDGGSCARTLVKQEGNTPSWREDFEFANMPSASCLASFFLRYRPPDLASPRQQHELRLVQQAYGLLDNGQSLGASSGYTGVVNDQTLGKVDVHLEELEASKDVEKWWAVKNAYGQQAGEVLIKMRTEESVVLMASDYDPLSQVLHKMESGLTLQVAHMIPLELKRLAEILLNIYQASGHASDWILALVEEEIDGVNTETPMSRLRFTQRVGSNDSDGAIGKPGDRELMVRDLNKNATLEANLLFRGNTLLTKALDAHMRRVGADYLISTLETTIKSLNDKNPDCEVDPNRVANAHDLQSNWRRLLASTQEVWLAIESSAQHCPVELRSIFKHIRACAEDRYGDFLRTVIYSSVSGFLFLRFFCPAVLNPKFFGILKDDPKPRARRTFTLIAKSLQGLANMASFGMKEHWMEPMNAFLGTHRDAFRDFIDKACFVASLPSDKPEMPPSYSTPLAIRNRLPLTSREGFPSLPYLIDQPREFAGLVELWLQGTGKQRNGIADQIVKEDGDLLVFHSLCVALHKRTKECLARSEPAERPASGQSFAWEELIEQLQAAGMEPANDSLPDLFAERPVLGSFGHALPTEPRIPVADDEGEENDAVGSLGGEREREWGIDDDAGTAREAATLLSQGDRNPRSGFILPSTSSSSHLTVSMPRTMSPEARKEAVSTPPISRAFSPPPAESSTVPSTPRTPRAMNLEQSSPSPSGRHSAMSSDTETALPSVSREKARAKQERWDRYLADTKQESERLTAVRQAKLEREREGSKLAPYVPGFAVRKKKDKEREKEGRHE